MLKDKQKAISRKIATAKRLKLHSTYSYQASEKICKFFVDFLCKQPAIGIVAGYVPIKTEINVLPLLEELDRMGFRICLPKIIDRDQPLDFVEWKKNSKLTVGKFGILYPHAGDIIDPDLMLCPLLSYDCSGNRLGYGGGFYDRTIEKLSGEKDVLVFGVAYKGQMSVDFLPVTEFDRRLDGVLTEVGITIFR